MSKFKQYIGDSVYADVENGMIKLTTNNGYPDDPRNVIYLEPSVFAALVDYEKRLRIPRATDEEVE